MSDKTGIAWTDATWNPVTGCSHVSPGCVNCYAEALSLRFGRSKKQWTAQNAAENVVLHPERVAQPLKWKAPRRVFVNSMSDLFHEHVPDDFIDRVFAMMALAPQHTYQVLTKRPERMRSYLDGSTDNREEAIGQMMREMSADAYLFRALDTISSGLLELPLANVWLGVSVEDQRRATERIPILRDTTAAVRFLSVEPMLEAIDLGDLTGIHWVICGGESGPHFRPFDIAWARSIRDQCVAQGVAFFFKQISHLRPGQPGPSDLAIQQFPDVASLSGGAR